MNLFTKRFGLVLAGVVGVGAVATLAMGASLAMFSSTVAPKTTTYNAGTLTLSPAYPNGDAMSCTYSNLVPGYTNTPATQTSPGTCGTTNAQGNGSNANGMYTLVLSNAASEVPAFVGVDLTITSTAAAACSSNTNIALCTGTGQQPLYDGQVGGGSADLSLVGGFGTNSLGQQLVSDQSLAQNTTCTAASAPGGYLWSCTATINDILIQADNNGNAEDVWMPGYREKLHVGVSWPFLTTDQNQFQGSTATTTITAFAVQSQNNTGSISSGTCDSNSYGPALTIAAKTNGQNACPSNW